MSDAMNSALHHPQPAAVGTAGRASGATGLAPALGAASPTRALADVIALTKPRITAMAVIVAAGAMSLSTTHADWLRGAIALLGIASAVSGAGALNMYIERDVDALMTRTRGRPLPAARLVPGWALVVGIGLSSASIPLLLVGANLLTVLLTLFSLFTYVLVYTPMKRVSAWSLVVGAVPGAMPALMGATAAAGAVERTGVALFLVVFLWQLPHFMAISIYREAEYTNAGHKVAPAHHGLARTKALVIATTVLLSAVGVALWPLGIGGVPFGIAALILGLWFTAESLRGLRVPPDRPAHDAWARRVFFVSLGYQTILFLALAMDALLARA